MRAIFRVDASFTLGGGHVFRCMALAETLSELGVRCSFVCREFEGHMLGSIRDRGFEAFSLPVPHHSIPTNGQGTSDERWLRENWKADASDTREVIGGALVDWLIVDHYYFDAAWEMALRTTCHRLLVIDDLANRSHACDLLLDHNPGREYLDYKALAPSSRIFAGPSYALLRAQFSNLRAKLNRPKLSDRVEHLLIMMGAVDIDNTTGTVLESLRYYKALADCKITVILGPKSQWLRSVLDIAQTLPNKIDIKLNVDNVANLISNADIVIGAGGVSALERCCLGVPSLVAILAPNQERGARALEAAGCVSLLGERQTIQSEMPKKLSSLLPKERRYEMAHNCWKLVDGQGAPRIVKEMLHDRN